MNITKAGALPTKRGQSTWFTGTVLVDEIATIAETQGVHVLRVSFDPGARTAWHSHPRGQTLHVLTGAGWVQKAGEPIREILPGDTVWIPPGERHWHGAAAECSLVHLAVQQGMPDGNEVTWFELVADEEYRRGPAR